MNKPEKFYSTVNEMTGKRSVKTNLKIKFENKDKTCSSTLFADMFEIKFVNFATPVEGPTTQELKECIKSIDKIVDNIFANSTNLTEVSKTVVKMKNN